MFEKILVGTDGSKTAARAVDRAVSVAKTLNGELTILSAGAPDRAAKVVESEAKRHSGSGVSIKTTVVEGDAVTGLVDAAAKGGYDLLVMGNRGMTGMSRFFSLGSVPNKVSHQLPCSLLIVKTT